MKTIAIGATGLASQCQKPTGWLGRILLWNMDTRHSPVTDWGLAQVRIEPYFTILDVGCGGGRTLSKLAEVVTQGTAFGVDYSEESVAASKRTNARWINRKRVQVKHASVSQLPFKPKPLIWSPPWKLTFGGPPCQLTCEKSIEF